MPRVATTKKYALRCEAPRGQPPAGPTIADLKALYLKDHFNVGLK